MRTNEKIWRAYIREGGAYIREEKHFNLLSVKLTFLSFFQYKARISAFFTSSKMWNMFKVNNKDTGIRKANDKAKMKKDTVDVVLAFSLLTLSTFYFLIHCLYFWLWSVNCGLGLLFVVLTLCACWNQFR